MRIQILSCQHHGHAKKFIGQTVKVFAKLRSKGTGTIIYLIEDPSSKHVANLFNMNRRPEWTLIWQDPSYIPVGGRITGLDGYMWVYNTECIELAPQTNSEAKILLNKR